jgi:hypothetical protein
MTARDSISPPLRDSAFRDAAQARGFIRPTQTINDLVRIHGSQYRTLNHGCASTLNRSAFRLLNTMSTASERIELMMKALGTDQPGFGTLSGASKSVVNQWLSGKIKSIDARYAFKLQKTTGFSAEWIQTGCGPEKTDSRFCLQDPPSSYVISQPSEVETLFNCLTPSQQASQLATLRAMVTDNERMFEELTQARKGLPENRPGFRIGGAIVENQRDAPHKKTG